jgi:hypothetical protein
MSATNIVCQPRHRCLHAVTDGASYLPDGTLVSIAPKAFSIPHWPGVVTGRGTTVMTPLLAWALSAKFATFDAAVAGTESVLPGIVEDFNLSPHHCELIIAGWSKQRNAPEVYVIKTTGEQPRYHSDEHRSEVANGTRYLSEPMRLVRLPDLVAGPKLSPQIMAESGFPGIDLDHEPAEMVERLRFVLECQRHDPNPEGKCWVGGFVQITTVTPDRIEQRILHRWDEDTVGRLIEPAPPDWSQFHAKSNVVKLRRTNDNQTKTN